MPQQPGEGGPFHRLDGEAGRTPANRPLLLGRPGSRYRFLASDVERIAGLPSWRPGGLSYVWGSVPVSLIFWGVRQEIRNPPTVSRMDYRRPLTGGLPIVRAENVGQSPFPEAGIAALHIWPLWGRFR